MANKCHLFAARAEPKKITALAAKKITATQAGSVLRIKNETVS
jgi:hypothetical protein